jgi:hypothetical protein
VQGLQLLVRTLQSQVQGLQMQVRSYAQAVVFKAQPIAIVS